jgi:serine/threonine protein kinase
VKVSKKEENKPNYLFKEYSILKDLNHESVVKVYDYLE